VDVLPHPSLAVNVLVCVRSQPLLATVPSEELIVVGPHPSVAVALPNAASISDKAGLQPRVVAVPLAAIDGGVLSCVHVTVLEAVAVLPHPSLAVNVLTWVRSQPLLVIAPSEELIVVGPHPSVALAEPRAASISEEAGLQPRVVAVPLTMIDGGVLSWVHVTVLEAVAVLPQPSLAVNILTWVRSQPLLATAPSEELIVVGPHPSVAVAEPRAASISEEAGLQPSVVAVPLTVIDGGVLS